MILALQPFQPVSLDELMHKIGVAQLANLLEVLAVATQRDDAALLARAPSLLQFYDADIAIFQLLGYRVSEKNYERLKQAVEAEPQSVRDIRRAVEHAYINLKDEIAGSYFVVLDQQEEFRLTSQNPFGREVSDAFPDSAYDIAEATYCLAWHRSTACVFHLAKVVETALRVVLKQLDFELSPNPSWEHAIQPLRQELNKPPKGRSAAWNSDPIFYASVSERVMAIRDGWRNDAIHISGKYTEQEAEDIYSAVAAFMRKVAEKLGQGS